MPWRQEGVRIDFLLNVDGVMKRDTVCFLKGVESIRSGTLFCVCNMFAARIMKFMMFYLDFP